MACGDRYRGMVRTAGGGTLDDPGCTLGVCGPDDFQQWRDLADEWHRHVERAWSAMQAAADKTSRPAPPDELYADLLAYQKAWKDLPDRLLTAVFETGEVGSSNFFLQKVVKNVADAVCLREQLENETRRLGGVQPAPVTTPPGGAAKPSGFSAMPWVFGAGIVVGGYALFRLMRKDRS